MYLLDKLYILQIHKYVSYTGDKKTPKDTMLPASKSQSHETFVYIYVHISKMVTIHIYICILLRIYYMSLS